MILAWIYGTTNLVVQLLILPYQDYQHGMQGDRIDPQWYNLYHPYCRLILKSNFHYHHLKIPV